MLKRKRGVKIDYKNNIENQRELLQKHLETINIVVSAKLGITVNLCVKENKDYRNQTFFSLVDDKNIKEECGIMTFAFRNVYIETFGMWWQENGVAFDLDFRYEHISGGSNGAHFCTIQIENDLLKLL